MWFASICWVSLHLCCSSMAFRIALSTTIASFGSAWASTTISTFIRAYLILCHRSFILFSNHRLAIRVHLSTRAAYVLPRSISLTRDCGVHCFVHLEGGFIINYFIPATLPLNSAFVRAGSLTFIISTFFSTSIPWRTLSLNLSSLLPLLVLSKSLTYLLWIFV